MVSRASLAPLARLAIVFLAGLGAQAAWHAGYFASLTLCGLLALWAVADLLIEVRQRAARADDVETPLARAMLAREREARTLATFLDHAPVPLIRQATERRLIALNRAARQFFHTDELIPDPPPALLEELAQIAPGERRTLTLEQDGLPRAYALTAADLLSDEEATRIVALVDVQAELQAAEAAALRELIQVLSHEVLNSLAPVTSLAQTTCGLLEEAAPSPGRLAEAREAARIVASRSEGLLRFIEAYRALARMPEPRFAPESLEEVLTDAALLFRTRWSAQDVTLEVGEIGDLHVTLDRQLIVQALINVLTNAAEAALTAGSPGRVRLSAFRSPAQRVVLQVEDTGPGVQLNDPSVIFRPFFTTKPNGTGVGLSLARQVALAHGGAIGVGPSALGGAAITITL